MQMGDSQSEAQIFSTRIVAMDYYMAAPIPDVDFCYSSFQGGKVNEVPVIRIYGPTPAGQKTCLHIHKALPYLYIPCGDLSSQPDQEGSAFTQATCLEIEKALKLRGKATSKRQHVHSCTLVRAKKFYGYHSSEELFMKIHLYHPQDISRLSSLLLGGVVLDKVLQPYESHIPFLLQFLIDYNLYGMGHIHLRKIKFRHPVPEAYHPKCVFYNCSQGNAAEHPVEGSARSKADLVGDQRSALPIWTSGTLPTDWMWPSWSPSEPPSGRDHSPVKRQSNSKLEGDAVVEDILNQLLISYAPLSQNSSEVRMVQSLVPIWEEERERSGMQGPDVSPNSGKPLPEDVLRMLSHWHGLETLVLETFGAITSNATSEDCIKGPNDDQGAQMQQISADRVQIFGSVSSPNIPAFDQDALGLLKWLASSEAVEEINSDDELAHESILSPLLPTTTIAKVLKKANTDFECLSQQECQDILDSVDDPFNEEGSSRGVSFSDDNGVSDDSSSNKMIPQVDGSSDDYKSFTFDGKPNPESGISERDDLACENLRLTSCSKKKRRRWGTLPVSDSANFNFAAPDSSNVIGISNGDPKVQDNAEAIKSSRSVRSGSFDHGNKEASTPSESSMRELMRKKRCYRTELPESSLSDIRQVPSEKEQEKDDILHVDQRNEKVINLSLAAVMSKLSPTDEPVADSGSTICPTIESSAVSRMGNRKSDFSRHGRSPVSFGSGSALLSTVIAQKWPAPAESLNVRADSEHILGFQDTAYGSSELVGECKIASKSAVLDNHKSPVCIKHDGCYNHQSEISHSEEIMFSDPVMFSHTPVLFLGENSEKVGYTVECPCQAEISVQETHEILNKNPKCKDLLEGSCCFPSTLQVDNNHEMSIFLPGIESSKVSRDSSLKADFCGLIGLTLCQKPPVIEFTSGPLSSVALSPSICHDPPLTKGNSEALSSRPNYFDGLPPFFMGDHLKGDEHKSVSYSRDDDLKCGNQGAVMGVPIHYQNDGSHVYILAPLRSPPSGESVKRWLLEQGTTSAMSRESAPVLSTFPQNLSVDLLDSQDSLTEVLELTLSGSSRKSGMNCNLNKSSEHNKDTHIEDLESRQDAVTVVQRNEPNRCKSKTYCSQGMSQLSGPDSKSKLTPSSQIGFRDPASIGGTQQLTILSIEVQAESRGDLRPNPQFDAINIIAVVVQADNPTSEAIILLRSSKESSRENIDGIPDCKVLVFPEEKLLFHHFVMVVSSFDPDMLMGWDVQGGSLGFLAERAAFLGISLLNEVSRTPSLGNVGSRELNASGKDTDLLVKGVATDSVPLGDAIIEDEWGRTHASGVHVGGRIVLNIWRLMRNEVTLNLYTVEAVAEAVLRRKIPFIPYRVLTKWFSSGPGCARYRCMEYTLERAKLNIRIMDQLDMINRTSELARVFGIDFFSVLSRGSQYRVESMFLRLAHSQNYLAISPGKQQVAYQPAMECLPLVMEPESGFFTDPVVVLDFQSLYPSMIIAYNLCFSTCLGKILSSKENTLGVSSYSPDKDALQRLKEEILITPNGVMYVPSKVRKGILPRLLDELLSTRIMIKQAMKKLDPSQQVLHRIFNARQLALKLIANVTYGYTAAGFSGRMPCAELADSIVQCGRRTLERSISFVNNHDGWKAKVVYGDTDSMFVLLKGRSREEAFKIGGEIAAAISAMNPDPVVLKMEKVYHPCFLLTKKRYVGYSYENPGQIKPKFDAKGIETIRRDTCVAVSKTMEQSLRLFFEHKDIHKVKSYLLRQWRRIMSGRISLQDFVFAKEVRLGTYSARASTLPPGAIIATKAMEIDPRAEPCYAERIPYVVVHGEPGARLVDMVVDPLDLLAIDSPFRLNDVYYIRKQIIPALQRVFGLVGADLNKWYSELPRPGRGSLGKRHLFASNLHRTRIDSYYLSRHCILCGALVHASSYLCRNCSACEATLASVLIGRTAKLEKDIQHLVAICRHCGGGDWLVESGVKCTSLACSVFYERRKVQKELKSVSAVATEAGFYPTCIAELF